MLVLVLFLDRRNSFTCKIFCRIGCSCSSYTQIHLVTELQLKSFMTVMI